MEPVKVKTAHHQLADWERARLAIIEFLVPVELIRSNPLSVIAMGFWQAQIDGYRTLWVRMARWALADFGFFEGRFLLRKTACCQSIDDCSGSVILRIDLFGLDRITFVGQSALCDSKFLIRQVATIATNPA